ncbi:hypothetical protein Glove_410g22 [Diversispora epigaea]|uniref:Uncharacterized protein n=1 Tax=Diversispora epigaea TaxID=1348612 RepID=A0A397H611_9GLOM|nr:hypothetical protein Glove_410g22 [Diversispora epigaea]
MELEALNLRPNDDNFLRIRSGVYQMLGHSDAALEDLEKACLLKPENTYQYALRGAIYLDMRLWFDSLINLNKAVDSHPNNKAIIFGNRAELLCKLRRYDLALEDIKQALKLEPNNIIFHQQLTDLYRRQHKYEEALTQANFTLLLSPNNINTRFGNALKDINESLKIKATNFHALEVRGSILKKQHKYQDALDDFNKSLELYPLHLINQHPFPNRGEDHIDNSGYDEGFVVTHKMMGERNFSNIYRKRGDTYYKLNEYELALTLNLRGQIINDIERCRLDDALVDIDKLLKEYPRCPKFLKLREKILNNIKKCNLKKEELSEFVLSNFGDMEEISIENNVNSIEENNKIDISDLFEQQYVKIRVVKYSISLNLRGQIINDIERCRLDDALVDIDKLLKEYPRCPKFLKLREKILNNIKKCNLKKEELSEFVLSNFGDMEEISIENNVNSIEEVESGPSNGSRQLQY